jgi:hypothetical protein
MCTENVSQYAVMVFVKSSRHKILKTAKRLLRYNVRASAVSSGYP